MNAREKRVRPWPETVPKSSISRDFFAQFRKAFDADPFATFCAGEKNGITLVVAVGAHAEELQAFVENHWDGTIERAAGGGTASQ